MQRKMLIWLSQSCDWPAQQAWGSTGYILAMAWVQTEEQRSCSGQNRGERVEPAEGMLTVCRGLWGFCWWHVSEEPRGRNEPSAWGSHRPEGSLVPPARLQNLKIHLGVVLTRGLSQQRRVVSPQLNAVLVLISLKSKAYKDQMILSTWTVSFVQIPTGEFCYAPNNLHGQTGIWMIFFPFIPSFQITVNLFSLKNTFIKSNVGSLH